jgi:hypothetical protein
LTVAAVTSLDAVTEKTIVTIAVDRASAAGITAIGRLVAGLSCRARISRVYRATSTRTSVGSIAPEPIITGVRVVGVRAGAAVAGVSGADITVITIVIDRTLTWWRTAIEPVVHLGVFVFDIRSRWWCRTRTYRLRLDVKKPGHVGAVIPRVTALKCPDVKVINPGINQRTADGWDEILIGSVLKPNRRLAQGANHIAVYAVADFVVRVAA